MNTDSVIHDYIEFQKHCLSPFHVVQTTKKSLQKKGFQELTLTKEWHLDAGKKYFVTHSSGKSLIAFHVGSKPASESGFSIIGSHSDSPVLHLKMNPHGLLHGYQILYSEPHGSLIYRSWLDRPLIVAGKVYRYKRDKNHKPLFHQDGHPMIESELVQSSVPLAVIPDLAIHLDREKNNLGMINPETMLYALTGCDNKKDAQLALQTSLNCEAFDGFDLNFAPYWPHCRVGSNLEFISGPRHDDLVMVFTSLKAFELASEKDKGPKTNVLCVFDSEETGSQTAGGASSFFIDDVLTRICKGEKGQAYAQSFLISADVAHGLHPSFRDKHDLNHKPLLNGGLVLKSNANDKYTTQGHGVSFMKALSAKAESPIQTFCARSDLGCGSTIGPILSTKIGCPSVDVGIAMLAMHSSCETVGALDLLPSIRIFECFYV